MFPDGSAAVADTVIDPPDAGAESPELESGAEAQGAEGGDPTGQQSTTEGAPESQRTGEGGWPIVDGKTFSPELKALVDELRASGDPKKLELAKHIRSAFFQADAFRRELPGGLKEVQSLRQALEDLGGEHGISALKQETEEWRALDQKFTAGDPSFLQQITETPEGKQSFLQLAPHATELFATLNPEGYSAYFAQVMTNHLYQQGVTLDFQRLGDFLQGNEPAMKLWQKIGGFLNGLSEMAKNPVAPKAAPRQPDNDRVAQLDQREQQLLQKEWTATRLDAHKAIFDPEFQRLTAGRKVSDQQRAAIIELFGSRLRSALNALPGHKDKIDRYFAAKDHDGYAKYFKAAYTAEIPKALRAAVDVILPTPKPGPKTGAQQTTTTATAPATTRQNGTAQQGSGFQFVAQMPKPEQLDRFKTTPDMIRQGKAILNDGRKVQWKRAQA